MKRLQSTRNDLFGDEMTVLLWYNFCNFSFIPLKPETITETMYLFPLLF